MASHNIRNQDSSATISGSSHRSELTRRACISCRQRKVRCDISIKGALCINYSSHSRPGCRTYPSKREAREKLAQSASLVPIRPRQSPILPTTLPSVSTETTTSTMREDEEHDQENLGHFLSHHDLRQEQLGHCNRSHFIGSELSNCHYLIRQSSSDTGQNKVVHSSNGPLDSNEAWYQVQSVPSEALKRADKQLEHTLIRAYFDFVNRGWPIVDKESFISQYHQEPKNIMTLALLNAILLVGAHVLTPQDEKNMVSLLPVFFQRAKALVISRFGYNRLGHIQVTLLITWHSVANAWHWIGTATRTAIAIGVHRDVSNSNMLPVYKRIFTRLWWVHSQFDTIASTSSGRPQVINLADSDVPELQEFHFKESPGQNTKA